MKFLSVAVSTLLLSSLVTACGGRAEEPGRATSLANKGDAGSESSATGQSANADDTSGGEDDVTGEAACAPESCGSLGAECGVHDDGCGGELDCGSCDTTNPSEPSIAVTATPTATETPNPEMAPEAETDPEPSPNGEMPVDETTSMMTEADAGSGQPDDCEPVTCDDLGLDCGDAMDDGCGEPLDCGECDTPTCEGGEVLSAVATATSSRGMGFTGTDDEYSSLYYILCETVADCEAACALVGGMPDMCAASECTENPDDTKDCLPATAWRNVTGASVESGDPYNGAVQSMVNQEYIDFLAVEGFGFMVPEDATIVGVTVEFLRSAGALDQISDSEIFLVRGGQRVGDARGYPGETWGMDLEWVSYGGPTDRWGLDLSPQEVNTMNFGAAIGAQYHEPAGNGRAYVDHARITVHYGVGCENTAAE